jgi:hypothetical protein
MKMIIIIIAILAVLAIIGFTSPAAFAQSFEEERLSFYPAFPTDKNKVTAIISLTTGTPCDKVELQDFELDGNNNNLSIKVRLLPPLPDTSCAQVVTQHVLKQNIGKLDAGTYAAQLYVDGVQRTNATLHVSAGDIAILSTGKYTDDQGGVNLVGEVQNAADHPARLVRIGVLFFEEDGALVKEEKTFTTMGLILPNRTSGFSLGIGDDLRDKEYSVNITSSSVEDRPVERGLTLVVEPALGNDGYGIVKGHVLNSADHEATQVKVVCAIYDNNDRSVIDSVFGYTDPDTITSGQTAQFSILTHSKVSQGFTASCNAESVELAIKEVQVVPEFPAIAAVSGASLAAVLATNRFRNKL